MEKIESIIKEMVGMMGFDDFSVNYSADSGRFSIFINDSFISENNLPAIMNSFDSVIKLIARKNNIDFVIVDINNYRRKREDLILEIARVTARKSVAEKKEMSLPIMNAYERRLVHTELAKHPDIKTESVGEGRERYVVIKPI
ncbi:MAG: R3H domain-containing nucleic acid-binding protein [Patescibacteria group bacterium]